MAMDGMNGVEPNAVTMDDGRVAKPAGIKRVMVTGGGGFIGARVVRALRAQGYEVRCLLRSTSNTRRIEGLDYERCLGDICDAAAIERALDGMDACIHLASISAWDQMDSSALEETILDGTRNVLEAARKRAGMRVVHVSSATAINGSPDMQVFDEVTAFELDGSPLRYAIAKHRTEVMCQDYAARGVDVVIVNPAEVYGPEDDAMVTAGNLRDFLRDWPCLACTGGTAVCHVDDVADGMVKALEKGRTGERYILGGDNLTVEQLARLTLDVAGQRKPVLRLPNEAVKWVVKGLHRWGLPTPVIPQVLDYATLFFFVDSGKAIRELGYQPRSARACVTPVVAWLKSAGHV